MELQSGAVRIASYRRKLPRKAKNIYLPTEVWVDVFCYPWISRTKMGRIVDQIGNRWFGEQLQFYLHEWGKHTLRKLHFFRHSGVCKWHNDRFQPLEYPQTVMPENIRFCKSFQIKHFDNRVFNFFRRIQGLLTADTKLEIYYVYSKEELGNVCTILGHLLPFIDGVRTLRTDDQMLPIVRWREKLNSVKVLDVHLNRFEQSAMQPIMEWLTSNEPKLLQLYCSEHEIDQQVLETIRTQFMEATEPATFAVVFRHTLRFSDFNCENDIREKLCGDRNEIRREFKVFRHQVNAEADEKLRKWVNGNMVKNGECGLKQSIRLSVPTIGSGDIFATPDLDETDEEESDKNEEEVEKPSTSNEGRICE